MCSFDLKLIEFLSSQVTHPKKVIKYELWQVRPAELSRFKCLWKLNFCVTFWILFGKLQLYTVYSLGGEFNEEND